MTDLAQTIQAAQAYLDPTEVECVVYHAPCNDGSGAAVGAWLKLGDSVSYVRRTYHKAFEESKIVGKNVVVLDASFKREELLALRAKTKTMMILDHHDSAMRDLADVPGCFFCMQNSGAVLSWHYFHGLNTPPPTLLRLIEDRDLWKWQERDLSEALYYALKVHCPNSDFKTYLPYVEQTRLNDLIAYGKTLIAKHQKWCEKAAQKAEHKTFTLPRTNQSYQIMCRELTDDRLVSELSEYLYTKYDVDFIMLWTKVAGEKYKVSFRSNKDKINLGTIATALGGGGHPAAAGAVLDYSPIELLS